MARQPIVVSARPVAGISTAPEDNDALRLSRSLAGFNEQANALIQGTLGRMQVKAETKAQADALRGQGLEFAEAVRQGIIEPTQNPWYITAYNQESAALSIRSDLTALQTDALTWEERSDPQAFQARWAQESGDLVGAFSSDAQVNGAAPVVREITSQVINSNIAQNVQRIREERTSNMSQLLAERIGSVNTRLGGNATGEQVFGSIEDLRSNWINTGGTDLEFDELITSAVTTAAYGSRDSDLLDVLRHDRGDGRGSIYNQAGVADSVENDRFRISSAREGAATERYTARYNQIREQGQAATDSAYALFGAGVLNGEADVSTITTRLIAEGHSPQAAATALDNIQRTISDVDSLRAAALGGGEQGVENVSLYIRAQQAGYSEELEGEIAQRVLTGEITSNDGRMFVRTAFESSRRQEVEIRREGTGLQITSASSMRDASRDMASMAAAEIESTFGRRTSTRRKSAYRDRINNAALRVVLAGGTWDAALEAAREETAAIILEASGQRQRSVSTSEQDTSGSNPRR